MPLALYSDGARGHLKNPAGSESGGGGEERFNNMIETAAKNSRFEKGPMEHPLCQFGAVGLFLYLLMIGFVLRHLWRPLLQKENSSDPVMGLAFLSVTQCILWVAPSAGSGAPSLSFPIMLGLVAIIGLEDQTRIAAEKDKPDGI